jgi:CRISPR-associated endonuclease/helicase Cas3
LPSTFGTLFPQMAAPSPSQRACAQALLGDGPVLAVVEGLTGSGKTEAALGLAARLISSGRAAGIYFALNGAH